MAQPESIPTQAIEEEAIENVAQEVESAENENVERLEQPKPKVTEVAEKVENEKIAGSDEQPNATENRSEVPLQQTPPTAPTESSGRGALFLAAALAVGLLLCGLALINQGQQVVALEGQVETLNVELAEAETQVAVYEATIAQVRTEVSDIIGRMTSLQALVGGPVEQASSLEPTEIIPHVAAEDGLLLEPVPVDIWNPVEPVRVDLQSGPEIAEFASPAAEEALTGIEASSGTLSGVQSATQALDAFGNPMAGDEFLGERYSGDISLESR
jgi:hypothetical protein